MSLSSKIIISDNFESIKAEYSQLLKPEYLKIFEYENLLMEGAREIISQAYIAENQPKVLLIMANKYGIDPQNALLKILEEPPRNIIFVLVAPAKNIFLPTVCSRLGIENRVKLAKSEPTGINFSNLNLAYINDYVATQVALEKSDKLSKTQLLNLLKSIIIDAVKNGVKFSHEDYIYFNKLYRITDLNAKAQTTLLPLLLLIMQRIK
ncbi:DNA polymerase III subunit delta' [Campylobacter porcelli]|uniref:DNA polymerase III subunit delta n=1 Tax=Campylobacter porcelli TaxID=1660073 RepID=A0A1X9SX94_9BACT|nr:DNA polymerase III subunit delta' [Campylobacter sp. RM6137]ARR00739.1 DNA polymerase III, delta prime subunit [Campylobacter sp. RM6137]MEE3743922.1 DNA polymerase III subunit delta' [Campylobacter sp. CX2-4855-23]